MLKQGFPQISLGIGAHKGNLMLGIIGEQERLESTVIADTVNTASRIEKLTKIYGARIIVSDKLYNEIKDLNFSSRFLGRITVCGKSNPIRAYEIFDADIEDLRNKKSCFKEKFEEAVRNYQNGEFESARNLFSEIIALNPEDKAARYYMEKSGSLSNSSVFTE